MLHQSPGGGERGAAAGASGGGAGQAPASASAGPQHAERGAFPPNLSEGQREDFFHSVKQGVPEGSDLDSLRELAKWEYEEITGLLL